MPITRSCKTTPENSQPLNMLTTPFINLSLVSVIISLSLGTPGLSSFALYNLFIFLASILSTYHSSLQLYIKLDGSFSGRAVGEGDGSLWGGPLKAGEGPTRVYSRCQGGVSKRRKGSEEKGEKTVRGQKKGKVEMKGKRR